MNRVRHIRPRLHALAVCGVVVTRPAGPGAPACQRCAAVARGRTAYWRSVA